MNPNLFLILTVKIIFIQMHNIFLQQSDVAVTAVFKNRSLTIEYLNYYVGQSTKFNQKTP